MPLFMLAIGFSFQAYANFELLLPLASDLEEVKAIMCEPAETLKYAIGTNAMGWILYTKATSDYGDESEVTSSFFSPSTRQIVRDLTTKPASSGDAAHKYAVELINLFDVSYSRTLDIASLVNNYSCYDGQTLHSDSTIGDRLFALTGDKTLANIGSCEEAYDLCFKKPTSMAHWSTSEVQRSMIGLNVRFLCADTCGCSDMFGGLWDLARAENGCPQQHCQRKLVNLLKQEVPCKDSEDLERPGWINLLHRLSLTKTINTDMHSNLTTMGCKALHFFERNKIRDVCSLQAGVLDHGMAPFCPESCRCSDARSMGVPQDCDGLCPRSCCRP